MEILEERDGYRVVLERDKYPEEPDDEGASPLLRIDRGGLRGDGNVTHVDKGKWERDGTDSAVENAAQRLFADYWQDKALLILTRYLHAWFGVTKVVTYRSDDYLYVTYDPAAWREELGASEGSISLDDYRAWIEGDVWGWAIQKRVTWVPEGDDVEAFSRRSTWETVDSCGGFYGYKYAESEAREKWAEFLRGIDRAEKTSSESTWEGKENA